MPVDHNMPACLKMARARCSLTSVCRGIGIATPGRWGFRAISWLPPCSMVQPALSSARSMSFRFTVHPPLTVLYHVILRMSRSADNFRSAKNRRGFLALPGFFYRYSVAVPSWTSTGTSSVTEATFSCVTVVDRSPAKSESKSRVILPRSASTTMERFPSPPVTS